MRRLIAAFAFAALPIAAQSPGEDVPPLPGGVPIPPPGFSYCYPEIAGVCVIRFEDYVQFKRDERMALYLLQQMSARIAAMKEKGCKDPEAGKLEVVPKNPPPQLKKERDS